MKLPAPLRVVTPSGRWLLLVALLCYLMDAVGSWSVFQLMWVACLVMGLLAVATVFLPTRARVDLTVSPPRAVAGDVAEVVLGATSVGRLRILGPVVDVPVGSEEHLIRLPVLRRHKVVEERIELSQLRRGVVPVGPVIARRSDPLGLLQWTERWSPATELLVLPRMVPVDSVGAGVIRDQEGTPSDEVSMSDLAFHALREYAPGDELRHVHWRSSAKAGKLQIRQYHDSRRSHLTVVIDDNRDSYLDPEDFETVVSTAASLAARAHQDGVDLSMLCGEHAVTGRGLDGVLDACCRIELASSSDPVVAARQALRLAPETSWLALLTGSAADEGLASALRIVLPPEVHLLLVRADGTASTSVSAAGNAMLVALRTLDELPRAVRAVASGAAR